MGGKWPVEFSQTIRLPRNCWVLLHAAKLRHGTGGFTSPPKEGMLRIFSPEKSDGFGRDRTREIYIQLRWTENYLLLVGHWIFLLT
jgi:hypothetical protein